MRTGYLLCVMTKLVLNFVSIRLFVFEVNVL